MNDSSQRSQRLPTSPEAMTVEWLGATLAGVEEFADCRIVGLRFDDIGAGRGFTSNLVRVELELEAAGSAPSTLIAKFGTGSPYARELLRAAYSRESTFYRLFQAEAPVRTPRCYFVAYDPDRVEYVLLLEDLHAFEGGDQLAGASDERIEAAVENLARLHAHFWRHPEIRKAIPRTQDDMDFKSARVLFREGLDEFKSSQGERYPRLVQVAETVWELISIPDFEPQQVGGRGPFTLLHGDYRLDNMFFGSEPGSVALIDWVVRVGRGGGDLGYFLFQSLTSEQLRSHGDRLMRLYHRTLREHGITEYSLRRVRSDCELVLSQLVSNQIFVQVSIARMRDGRLPAPEPIEGDGPEALRSRFEAFLLASMDTDRALPLFQAMLERLDAAVELHPAVLRRLRIVRMLIGTQLLWRRLFKRR